MKEKKPKKEKVTEEEEEREEEKAEEKEKTEKTAKDAKQHRQRDIKAVLLDMDGVLVKSKEAWFRAFKETAGVERETFDTRYWGRDLNKNLAEIGGDRVHFCEMVFPKHSDAVEIMGGVDEALKQLREAGLSLAIITNTTERCTRKILSGFGLEGYFQTVVTSDTVSQGKPHPEMVIHACSTLGVRPREAVVVGDSEEDMSAGQKAGCHTVGFKVDGDDRIEDLSELPQLITAISSEQ